MNCRSRSTQCSLQLPQGLPFPQDRTGAAPQWRAYAQIAAAPAKPLGTAAAAQGVPPHMEKLSVIKREEKRQTKWFQKQPDCGWSYGLLLGVYRKVSQIGGSN